QHLPMLYLFCGKMAAGKSTLAKKIARESNSLLLCEDDLLAQLFPGQITDLASYVKLSSRLKSCLEAIVVDALKQGNSIVLDFPANTVKQRAWLVGLAERAKVDHELRYIRLSDSACKAQLQRRVAENPQRASTDTVDMFESMARFFEPPGLSEGLNVLVIEPADKNLH
ncbi:MAG: AAA family ATPase, partial [Granulosicoccus sp.]